MLSAAPMLEYACEFHPVYNDYLATGRPIGRGRGDTDIFLTSKGTYDAGSTMQPVCKRCLSVLHHGSRWGKKGFYATTARINFQRGGFFLTSVLVSAPSFRAGSFRIVSSSSKGWKIPLVKKGGGEGFGRVWDGKSKPRRRKPRGEGFLDDERLGGRTRDEENRPVVGTETRASSKFDIISNNVCLLVPGFTCRVSSHRSSFLRCFSFF